MEPISPAEAQKSKLWKFFAGFLLIIVLALAGLWGIAKYERYVGAREVNKLADAMEQFERAEYDRAMADTYGGRTPEETLALYIEAVEKGDYALASKYFILDKQEAELRSWHKATEENISRYVVILKDSATKGGKYSTDKKEFSFNGDILIRLLVYPNGIWKIIEI